MKKKEKDMQESPQDRSAKKRKGASIAETAALYREENEVLSASGGEKTSVSPVEELFRNAPRYTGKDPSFGKSAAEDFVSGRLAGERKEEETASSSRKAKEVPSKSPHAGHRQRLRARYLKAAGDEGMTDYDVLELLLTYCIPRRDVKEPARALLEKFGTLGNVMDAEMEELCTISGISENSALLFPVMRDLCSRYLKEKMLDQDVLDSPDKVRSYAKMKLGGCKEEVMLIVYLNTRNCVTGTRVVSRGTINSAVVYPRNIAEDALKARAAGVILVHNHPSGCVRPSVEDMEFTDSVKHALASLDIRLLDHIIVSRSGIYSFFRKIG